MTKQILAAAVFTLMAFGAEAGVFTSDEGLLVEVSRQVEKCAQTAVTTAVENGVPLDTDRYGYGVAQSGNDSVYDRYYVYYLPVVGVYDRGCYVVQTETDCRVTKAALLEPRWYSRCPRLDVVE